jgi:hypothetical protein
MRVVRTIFAIVIALSVAVLPTGGSVALAVGLMAQGASEEISMAPDMSAMDDRCPDHAKANHCGGPSVQCPAACCVASPASVAQAAYYCLDSSTLAGELLPLPVDQVVCPQSSSPPFRPPRV